MSACFQIAAKKAWTSRNAAAVLYYEQHRGFVATSSYETFINSWAGELWHRRNLPVIEARVAEQLRRFGTHWKIR